MCRGSIIFIFLLSVFQGFAQQQFSVYFESNKHELNGSEKLRLQQWVAENPGSKIVAMNGYTDEDGTSGYNDTLAKKRVDYIFNSIVHKIKIRDDFKTRSFGENHKLSENKNENRKVTLYFIGSKDLSREDEILGTQTNAQIIKKEIIYPDKIVLQNPDGTKSELRLDIAFMKRIGEAGTGEMLQVPNLNFHINTFIITNDSKEKLYELLLIMQKNPGLKIALHGHLCCSPQDKQDLSTKRAKAVYGFLIANDIEKSRLSYKGFGSTKSIYPLPEKNEAERAANRRVEIEITENP